MSGAKMFGKTIKIDTLQEDAAKVDDACSDVEHLRVMIENSQRKIDGTIDLMQERVTTYEVQLKRLKIAREFCAKLLKTANSLFYGE